MLIAFYLGIAMKIWLNLPNVIFLLTNCYKPVKRFRVTCLLTVQYDTREYGTIAGVI